MDVQSKRVLKKGIDGTESRHKRQEATVQLRASKREEQVQKRRRVQQEQEQEQEQDQGQGQGQVPPTEHVATLGALGLLPIEAMAKQPEVYAPRVIQLITSLDTSTTDLVHAVRMLRQFTAPADKKPRLTLLLSFNPNLLRRLCELLSQTFAIADAPVDVQLNLVWALSNFASGTSEQTQQVLQAGVLPLMEHIIVRSPHLRLCDQAIWAIGNIAGDSCAMRDTVLASNLLAPILNVCCAMVSRQTQPQTQPQGTGTDDTTEALALLNTASWALSNLVRGKPSVQLTREQTTSIVGTARLLLAHRDTEVLANACWLMSYLSDTQDAERTQLIVETGLAQVLVPLLAHPSKDVKTAALRTVGNLTAAESESSTQAVIDARVLPMLRALLASQFKSLRQEAAWTLSNIAAGPVHQIGALIGAELVAPLVQMLQIESFDAQKEVAWTLCNIVLSGTPDQVRHLLKHQLARALCPMLECPDIKLLTTILEAFEGMLAMGAQDASTLELGGGENAVEADIIEAGGLSLLERLSSHENTGVYRAAENILKHYFADEDEEEEDVDHHRDMFSYAPHVSGPIAPFHF